MSQIIERASAIVNDYPATKVKLDEHAIHVIVENPNGFSLSLIDEGAESTLRFGKWHYSFSEESEALRIFEECLAGEAQLREIASLGIPYKGFLEIYEGESQKPVVSYVTGSIMVLFLWPFPKKERRYRNVFEKAAKPLWTALRRSDLQKNLVLPPMPVEHNGPDTLCFPIQAFWNRLHE